MQEPFLFSCHREKKKLRVNQSMAIYNYVIEAKNCNMCLFAFKYSCRKGAWLLQHWKTPNTRRMAVFVTFPTFPRKIPIYPQMSYDWNLKWCQKKFCTISIVLDPKKLLKYLKTKQNFSEKNSYVVNLPPPPQFQTSFMIEI